MCRNEASFAHCGSLAQNDSLQLLEKVACLYADRHTELQSLWQEMGKDKWQKLQELSEMLSKAVLDIYCKVLEENRRQKLEMVENVRKSEVRLKEHIGSRALQVIAPKDFSLQARLKMNLACLKDIYVTKGIEHAPLEQSLVLTRLCNQVSALREMLKLSPCVSTSLNEVLASAMGALPLFYSETSAFSQFHSEHHGYNSPLIQLLYDFYRTLRAMEADLLFVKATRKVFENPLCRSEAWIGLRSQDLRKMGARKRSLEHKSALIPIINPLEDSCTEMPGPRPHISRNESRIARSSSTVEKLGHKILKKLERIAKQVKYAVEQDATDMTKPFSTDASAPTMEHYMAIDRLRFSENCKARTQALDSKVSSLNRSSSSVCIRDSSSSTLLDGSAVKCSHLRCEALVSQSQSSNPADECQASEDSKNLANGAPSLLLQNGFSNQSNANTSGTMPSFPATGKSDKEMPPTSCAPVKRLPLIPITNNQAAPGSAGQPSSQVIYPPPPPPPPPPPSLHLQFQQRLPARLPPPPPPPPPFSSISGVIKAQLFDSAKLKKSATISRLYMEMKKKAEGVAPVVHSSTSSDGSVQRRAIVGVSTREGMAEALAEITKRSAYFRKIEDDVNKQASSILYVKSRLEMFETDDMNELLKFHRSIEVHLEQLTDESQVLARFNGFPVRKLEAIRAAASLHMRLTTLMEQTESWMAEPRLLEHLERVTVFFDKVKMDVEAIERTKDEDMKRFIGQKIKFDFNSLNRTKEAVVHLSSKCLALALKESQRTKKSAASGSGEVQAVLTKDMNKQRVSFQMLYRTFHLAYRVHNFAGGHDEIAEQLCSELACEMEAYPSSFWLELVHKQ